MISIAHNRIRLCCSLQIECHSKHTLGSGVLLAMKRSVGRGALDGRYVPRVLHYHRPTRLSNSKASGGGKRSRSNSPVGGDGGDYSAENSSASPSPHHQPRPDQSFDIGKSTSRHLSSVKRSGTHSNGTNQSKFQTWSAAVTPSARDAVDDTETITPTVSSKVSKADKPPPQFLPLFAFPRGIRIKARKRLGDVIVNTVPASIAASTAGASGKSKPTASGVKEASTSSPSPAQATVMVTSSRYPRKPKFASFVLTDEHGAFWLQLYVLPGSHLH